MRSPVIAFSIFAAATVGPTLVSGAPAPASPDIGNITNRLPIVGGLPQQAGKSSHIGARAFDDPNDSDIPPSTAGISGLNNSRGNRDKQRPHPHKDHRRAFDDRTAGGNAYTGGTSNSSGGTIVNANNDDSTLTNDIDANTAGAAGESESGDAEGGHGRGRGPGGNAYTGSTGPARGGDVVNVNDDGAIDNTDGSNTAGDAAASESGNAFGGDAVKKRATDDRTAGGNAYSGSSGSTSSGNVINDTDEDGTIDNTGPATNVSSDSGDSTTGDAVGGDGNFKGPGGNAYSGFAGPTRGGYVVNEGGTVENSTGANVGGAGGASTSGNSVGGDA